MKKFLLLFFAFLLPALVISTPVFANTKEISILQKTETVDKDYFAIAERVEVNGVVNGDAYVAGGIVLVNGDIKGDLLSAGGNITISGNVTGDVRVAGGNVTFSDANVGGNVTVGGGNVTFDKASVVKGSIVGGGGNLQIFSTNGRGATLGGGSILIDGFIKGDVSAGANNLILASNANIDGDFIYYSENEAKISDGANILGEVKHEIPKQGKTKHKGRGETGLALAGFIYAIKAIDIFWLIIIGLLLIYSIPIFSKRTAELATKKIGWAFLAGLGVLLFLPIVGVVFMVSIIGIPIALIIFFAFFLVFWLGRIFSLYALGLFVLSRFKKKDARGLAYITGIVIYVLLSIVPVIDFVASAAISIVGVGALVITKGQVFKELRSKKHL